MVPANTTIVKKVLALVLIAGAIVLGLSKSSIIIPFTAIHFENNTDIGVWPPNYTPYTTSKNIVVTNLVESFNTSQSRATNVITITSSAKTYHHTYAINVELVVKGFKIISGAIYLELEVRSKKAMVYKVVVYGPRGSVVSTKDVYANSTAYLQLARPCRSLEPGTYTIHLYLNNMHLLSKKLFIDRPKIRILNSTIEAFRDTKILKLLLVSDIPTFIRKAVVIENSSTHEHVYLCKPVYNEPTMLELKVHEDRADIVLLDDKGVELAKLRFVNGSILKLG